MYILGLNAYHGDSSACIFKDGQLLAASEEERFRRIKHWAGFPSEAIKFCLNEADIGLEDLDYITISRDPRANITKKLMHIIRNQVSMKALKDRFANRNKISGIKQQLSLLFNVPKCEIKAKVKNIEHHRCHLASAFYASPFNKSAILSIDGFGDFTSTMTGIGNGNEIKVIQGVTYPDSLGIFYTTITQYLGFSHYGDEYKMMGLAPYGRNKYEKELRKLIEISEKHLFHLNQDYFTHSRYGVNMSWQSGSPHIEKIFSHNLEELLGPARQPGEELSQKHKDIAHSTQIITEAVIFHILNHLYKMTGEKNICIAGGVAQNSVANGKILSNTFFDNLYIPSAGHDAGTAIGSALWLYNNTLEKPRIEPLLDAYTGPIFTNSEIETILKDHGILYQKYEDEDLVENTAEALSQGAVVGWFQGRSEFGPRALGHRSILVDPSRDDAKELLNSKIKRRESFRPFAPSILEEHVKDFFETDDQAPFMEKVLLIKEEKRTLLPAVTHVDGTGRLQTVKKGDKYYDLIESFFKKTGVPILLNTSFNENEPIVNNPQEAIDCFLRTDMDVLVLENCYISRPYNKES